MIVHHIDTIGFPRCGPLENMLLMRSCVKSRSCPFREGLHCKCLGRPGSSCPGMPLAPRGSPCLDKWYVLLSVVMLTCDPRCLSLAVALPNIDSECRLAKPQNLPKRANCARWSGTSCPEAGCGASVCPSGAIMKRPWSGSQSSSDALFNHCRRRPQFST